MSQSASPINWVSDSKQKFSGSTSTGHAQGSSTFDQGSTTTRLGLGVPAIPQAGKLNMEQTRSAVFNHGTQQFPSVGSADKDKDYSTKSTNRGTHGKYAEQRSNDGSEPRMGVEMAITNATEGISGISKSMAHRKLDERSESNSYVPKPPQAKQQPSTDNTTAPFSETESTESTENAGGGNGGVIQSTSFPVGASTTSPESGASKAVVVKSTLQQIPARPRKGERAGSGGSNGGTLQIPGVGGVDNSKYPPDVTPGDGFAATSGQKLWERGGVGEASNSTPHIDDRVQPTSKVGRDFAGEDKVSLPQVVKEKPLGEQAGVATVNPQIPEPARPNQPNRAPEVAGVDAGTDAVPDHPTQDDLDERVTLTDFSSSTEDLSGSSGARALLRKIQGYMPLMMKTSTTDPETGRNKPTRQKKYGGWLKSKGNLKAERTNVDQITPDDVVIAVMGPTGSGKSSFISFASELDMGIGHSLKSHTAEVSMVRFSSPALTDSDIVLVDTPGFDDTEKTDVQILTMISDWLSMAYKERILLAGLLYFHRISDNRMAGTPLKNLKMFQELCGKGMLKNVILVTTMWDDVDPETGRAREAQLREKYWKGMITQGSSNRRYLRDARSTFLILEPLVEAANTRNAEILKAELAEIEKNKQTLAAKMKQLLLPRRQDSVPSLRGETTFDADSGVGVEGTQGTDDRRGRGKGVRTKAIPKGQPRMRIQKEMHDYDLDLQATSAGQALYAQLGSLVTRREEFLKRMKEQMSQLDQSGGGADRQAALSKELEDLKKKLEVTLKEMEELKLPLGDRLKRIIRTTISMKH